MQVPHGHPADQAHVSAIRTAMAQTTHGLFQSLTIRRRPGTLEDHGKSAHAVSVLRSVPILGLYTTQTRW
jgi:hypothetical protein